MPLRHSVIGCVLSICLMTPASHAAAPPLNLPEAQWQGTVFHVVQEGEALGTIVMERYPDLRGNWQRIIRYIVEINPSSFPDNDPDRLQPGELIEIPNYDAAEQAVEPTYPRLPVIGAVVQGSPRIVDRYQRSGIRIAGDPVNEGDVAYGEGGSLSVIRLIDGSVIEVRPNSQIELSTFSYGQQGSSKIVLKLIKGGLRMVSGLFGKQPDASVEVRTPGGIIGVRGTDFAVRHCEGDECTEQTDALGSVIGLLEGGLAMDNAAVDDFAIEPLQVFLVADESSVPEPRPDLVGLLFSPDQWPEAVEKPRPCTQTANRTGPRRRCQ